MDDLDDQLLDQEEMNDMFSRPIGQDMYMNDADLESGMGPKKRKKIFLIIIFDFFFLRIGWSC